MGYSTHTKLFDSCVAPVLDYSSGGWDFSKYNCLQAIQNIAICIYLGVHKFAPILALQGDMGWMPTANRQLQYLSMLRFSNQLLKLLDNRLTKWIFIDDFYFDLCFDCFLGVISLSPPVHISTNTLVLEVSYIYLYVLVYVLLFVSVSFLFVSCSYPCSQPNSIHPHQTVLTQP